MQPFPKIDDLAAIHFSNIVAQRSSVDLPEPDGPMMETISPSPMLMEISFSTDKFSNDFST